MNPSRRELAALLPVFLVAAGAEAAPELLPSKCYPFDSLPVKTNPKTHNETRPVLDGLTHAGCHIDLHITTLQPGEMPHPPHTHLWEEMVLVQKGTLDVTINGRTTRIGPGSVGYVASNQLHGWKNVGDTPAQYFVLAFREVEHPASQG
jgi:quercetin dioxygenase-like cupin family protein